MTVAELFMEREKQTLSPYAFLTCNTKGRQYPCQPCPNRTEFQRDRDRITHSKSFRRLMHKTQVFLSPEEEHFRTRMTHTLEVTQIARIVARALNLNEDLCEAGALGHDLGHTPFGHAGEVVMQKCFSADFTHYKQSLRVVDKLEKDGKGLNLTYEVRDAILNHAGDCRAETLEGRILKFADRIAYINHDIDDACRAGILTPNDIPAHLRRVLGETHSTRINTMVTAVIEGSEGKNAIEMTHEVGEATNELRDFMRRNVYTDSLAKAEEDKAQDLLISLYQYHMEHPEEMPLLYQRNIERDGLGRCVCDYISGMTDRYAIARYEDIFVPKVWRGQAT